jgi:hypothetical protein
MVQVTIFLISILFAQTIAADQSTTDKNFNLIEDFEKNKAAFRREEFDLTGHSIEGGHVTADHSNDKDYVVVDIWIFGEMGKVNTTYWTDKNLHYLIVKRTDFEYDKPFYEKDFKVTEAIKYLSYNSDKVKGYDNDRKQLSDPLTIEMKNAYEDFFEDLTKDLKIIK